MKTIAEALKTVGCPVCHPPYTGKEDTYITYQLLGQTDTLYAEGRERETSVSYAISIFTDSPFIPLMLKAKELLEAAGYIVTVEMEHYDKETQRRQVSLVTTIEGANYG